MTVLDGRARGLFFDPRGGGRTAGRRDDYGSAMTLGYGRRVLTAALAASWLVAGAVAGAGSAAPPTGPVTPSDLVAGTGVMPAPPSATPWEWEPQLAIDSSGVLWAVGGHCPFVDEYGSCGAPTEGPGHADILAVWRSPDAGRSWRFVADPLAAPGPAATLTDTPGSSDPDIAVAPQSRPGRPPLLATVSLYGASSTLAVSADAGKTWAVVPAVGVPGEDRPWLAASGTCNIFLEYDPIADLASAGTVPRVDRYDGCTIADSAPGLTTAVPQTTSTVEPASAAVTNGNQLPGKLAAGSDGSAGPASLYAAYLACDSSNSCTLGVAESRDLAASWTDVIPPRPTLTIAPDPTFPISASADQHDNVAVAVTDRHHVYLWLSGDGGRSWPVAGREVDAGLGWTLANVPSVAVRGNDVVVSWYASPPSPGPQPWYLVTARSTDRGAHFGYVVSPPVLATTGHGQPLSSALYDDFGSAITPSGADVVVYNQSC
ncbi:MAG: hypothetical protein ACYDB7_13435, partial [Mycobacteriales bacterium]